jgi:hypothetical protein
MWTQVGKTAGAEIPSRNLFQYHETEAKTRFPTEGVLLTALAEI